MPPDDTTPASSRSAVGAAHFPSTCWSRIIGRTSGTTRDPDLEALLTMYWRPIHAYLSRRHRLGREEADDVTQDFLLRMLEGSILPAADPRRGRFRAFIKRALDHHVIDRSRAARTTKRGGAERILSLDFVHDDDTARPTVDPHAATPDDLLDAEWRRTLVAGALEDVERSLEAEGKGVYFAIFQAHFLSAERPSHRDLAAAHDVQLTDVSNYLRLVKNRYRAQLDRRIRETVSDDDDYRAELAWMFGPAPEDRPS